MIVIRPAVYEDAEEIEKVRIQAWKESYQGIIEQSFLDPLSYQQSLSGRQKILQNSSPGKIFLVAVDQDKIIGFCDAGPNRIDSDNIPGEIYAIYLLEAYKQLGIGKKLFKMAQEHLMQQGLIPYVVWALEKNQNARRFYEKMGGVMALNKMEIDIGEDKYTEISYIYL